MRPPSHLGSAALLPLVLILGACLEADDPTSPAGACTMEGWYAVRAEVRNEAGMPAARGATVRVLERGAQVDEHRGYADSLVVMGASGTVGLFDVVVTKPHHRGDTVRGVRVEGDPLCGKPDGPTIVPLTLTLEPGAPSVRQVVVPTYGYGFGDGNITARVTAFVEANEGVSKEVRWTSRDTTVARITPDGQMTSACRDAMESTYAVAHSVADPTVRDSVRVTVRAARSSNSRCDEG